MITALHWIGILFHTLYTINIGNKAPEKQYPQGEFRLPVGHAVSLSGNFGELRPNHFHAGIDIRAASKAGDEPIYAAAEGYVSRIKVAAGGYGNALYIAHPNGYTTVYAHLERYSNKLAEYIRSEQYAREQFEIDVNPTPGALAITAGELVGMMGNSGHSFGKHLHFEIRDSQTEETINPLLFGLSIPDNVKPQFYKIRLNELDEQQQQYTSRAYVAALAPNGNYIIKGDTLRTNSTFVGLSVKAFDGAEGCDNNMSIYALEVVQDGALKYNYKMDKFSFDNTRYCNAHCDYTALKEGDGDYHRGYTLPGNSLPNYYNDTNGGLLQVPDYGASRIEVTVSDVYGNKRTLSFFVKKATSSVQPNIASYTHRIAYNSYQTLADENAEIEFEQGCLYTDLLANFHVSHEQLYNVYSPIYHIDPSNTPIHKPLGISIRPTSLPSNLYDKAVVGYCKDGYKFESIGGEWQGDRLKAYSLNLGDFCITTDTRPPSIVLHSTKTVWQRGATISFKVDDDMSKIGAYRATMDGQWVLMSYDAKYDLMSIVLPDDLYSGTHYFEVRVSDERKNEALYSREFKVL
jgi:hypothetical protein